MHHVEFDNKLKHWYVCFSDAKRMAPGQKYLKKGFRHVKAFGFDPGANVWIIFDPGWEGISLRAISDTEQVQRLIAKAYSQGPVLYVETGNDKIWKPRWFMVCSSEICHLVGMDLFVHTPWRLFCALKQRGATELLFEDI
jgi:hypothetical protein